MEMNVFRYSIYSNRGTGGCRGAEIVLWNPCIYFVETLLLLCVTPVFTLRNSCSYFAEHLLLLFGTLCGTPAFNLRNPCCYIAEPRHVLEQLSYTTYIAILKVTLY